MPENDMSISSLQVSYPSSTQIMADEKKKDVPTDLIFILQTAGDYEKVFDSDKQLIYDFSKYMFENYQDVNVYIITFGVMYLTNINAGVNGKKLSNIDEVNQTLNQLKYENANKAYCDRSPAFQCLALDMHLRENSDKFIYKLANGNTDGKNINYDHFYAIDGVEDNKYRAYSEIVFSNWRYVEESHHSDVINKIADNNDLFLSISSTTLDVLKEHFQRKKSSPMYEYNIIVPTGWKTITLKEKLQKGGKTNSDKDSLTDWQEVIQDKIKVDEHGEIVLPMFNLAEALANMKRYNDGGTYNFLIKEIRNIPYLPIKSDPTDEDTDDDGLNDDIDPNPNSKDITITNILHEDYLKITHDNDQYYGSNQDWLKELDQNTLMNYNIPYKHECGLIASGDLIAYLNIYNNINMKDYAIKNGFNELTDSPDIKDLYSCFGYNETSDTIDSMKYMNYMAKLSSKVEFKKDFGGTIPFGSSTSTKSCLNEIFKYDTNYNYSVNWRNDNSLDTLKARIKGMLTNNIPVIISYENSFIPNTPSLNLYTKNDLIYTPENDTMSHYMVITGIIEYSADASKLSKHSIMIRVSSWGEEYYIDLEDYCNLVNSGHIGNIISNFSSNILEIRREQK